MGPLLGSNSPHVDGSSEVQPNRDISMEGQVGPREGQDLPLCILHQKGAQQVKQAKGPHPGGNLGQTDVSSAGGGAINMEIVTVSTEGLLGFEL